jgi:hypothetical protein
MQDGMSNEQKQRFGGLTLVELLAMQDLKPFVAVDQDERGNKNNELSIERPVVHKVRGTT